MTVPLDLSVVVVFHDMEREAPRTLHTLTSQYQVDVEGLSWEVLAIDNSSPKPLSETAVRAAHPTARLIRFETTTPSPVEALNEGLRAARSRNVMCLIDGARMLSPGIIRAAVDLFARYENPLIATPALFLGSQLQTDAVASGYDQQVEDELLASVDWQSDGYQLFTISNLDAHLRTVFLPLTESNCFAVRRDTIIGAGGFDERFISVGGGLANLELFERLLGEDGIEPITLLGEATFHQFHGGVTTNRPRRDRPMQDHHEEYRRLVGRTYRPPDYRPLFIGRLPQRFFQSITESNVGALLSAVSRLSTVGRHSTAIGLGDYVLAQQPGDPRVLETLSAAHLADGNLDAARDLLREAIEIAPGRARLWVALGRAERLAGDSRSAFEAFRAGLDANPFAGGPHYELGNHAKRSGDLGKAREHYRAAMELEPNDSRFVIALARIESLLANHDAAVELARTAVERAPTNGRSRLIKAAIHLSAGQTTAADAEHDELMRLADGLNQLHPAVFVDLAHALSNRRREDEADQVARRAHELHPLNARVRKLVAERRLV